MTYCAQCITPASRPMIRLEPDGICSACKAHARKAQIDWERRAWAFREVVNRAKALGSRYDCVIPVSGGKDSTWQVVTCLRYGLRPLAVTWRSPVRTAIGARNLENLVSLGVDHLDYQVNPKVERKFLYEAVVRYGDPGIPMHMAMFHIPLTIAVTFAIPLVIWGENPAMEHGSDEDGRDGVRMDPEWVRRYGAVHGTTAKDWIGEALTEEELTPYAGPSEAELAARGVLAVFLGSYFKWDPALSLEVARAHGFQVDPEGPRTGCSNNYADLDDVFMSVYHHLKWYKFGYIRMFDDLSLEIRHGRMTRQQAIEILRERGAADPPHEEIGRCCAFLGITRARFVEIVERFRNPEIWVKAGETWVIKDFVIPDWDWARSTLTADRWGDVRRMAGGVPCAS